MFADYLIDQAHQYTQNVQTYSIGNSLDSTLKPAQITYLKGAIKIEIEVNGERCNYQINTFSDGMISNTLAAILILKNLNIPVKLNTFITSNHSLKY